MLRARIWAWGQKARASLACASAVALAGAFLVLVPVSPAAAATEAITVSKEAPDNVLVGDAAEMRLTAANAGDVPEYNLTFRDVLAPGLTYRTGSTSPASLGEPQVITLTGGQQVLIWANVSDLPVGAEQTLRFEVTPDPTDLPVGATFHNVGNAYTNADPRTLPRFDAEGDYTLGASAQATSLQTSTDVTAIKVEKLEPSPEHELVRGVHNHSTTYTLRVTNNDHNPDHGAVLVDYLPAQLEFLGCGDIDNTPGGAVEYAGAPRLDASTPDLPGCVTPYSVTTVTDPAGVPAGLYTRVEWHLSDLGPTEVRDVVYAAGIPQRANTMDFPAGTPTPESLGQAANLDNNTGPSTRETGGEQALTNHVTISADYQGPVAGGGSTAVSDTDQLTVTSEDLAIQKSVTPGTFDQGEIATYTLQLQTSEYADATDIVITDVIPNGLCPLGGPGTNYASTTPAECEGSGATAPSHAYGTVTEDTGDGTFTVVFSPIDIAHDGTASITYQARMLENYRGPLSDPTVVGDEYTNTVSLTGTTTTLASVDAPGGVSDEIVQDESQATIHSDTVLLDKQIQPNVGTPYTCSTDASDYENSASLPAEQTTFNEGSRVCFLLRIDFPGGNETKNAVLTDFLPDYLAYESVEEVDGNEVNSAFDPADLTFTLGDESGGNYFVPRGQTFLYRISGIVTRSASGTTPDIPGNLAKLRWTDTEGTVGFLRDQEDFRVPPPPPVGVTKTANRATATAPGTTGPLADGGTVRIGDVVDYTVTVTNDADPADGSDVVGPDTWDRLPAGISCAEVSLVSDAGVCTDPGDLGQPAFSDNDSRSAIRWNLPDTVVLQAGDSEALTYRVTYPASTSANRTYTNDVDVASYSTTTNLETLTDHYPAQNVDTGVDPADIDAPRAHDDHRVVTPQETVDKVNVTDVNDTTQGSNGSVHYAAVGETVTYTIDTTLPADTTVYSGVLTDAPPAGLRVDSVTYQYKANPADPFGALPGGWVTSIPPAAARVTLPATVVPGSTDDTVRMIVTATVTDDAVNNTHGDVRTNTATFRSEDETGATLPNRSDASSITVVEPQPSPTKLADDDTPGAGQSVTFTLTARNVDPTNLTTADILRPTLFDSELVDCVPEELAVDPGTLVASVGTSATVEAVGSNGCAATRTPVVWQVGDLAWRSVADADVENGGTSPWPTLTYTVTTDPTAAGGAEYTNTATLSGTSMNGADPDERTSTGTTSETVTVPGSQLVKSVTPSMVTVGDLATYTLEVTLPEDVNFYDATIVDELPSGIDVDSVTLTDASCTFADPTAGACSIEVMAGDALTPDGSLHGWFLDDVLANSRPRTVVLSYTALVEDVAGNVAGATLENSARLRWNLTDEVTSGEPSPTDSFDSATDPGNATVTVVEPDLSIAKSVGPDDHPLPGEDFTYTVRVTNATGANVSTAYDVDVQDVVPAGVRVLSATISHGGALTGGTTGGGTIDWTDLGPLAPGAFVEVTYDARLATPAPSAAQVNTATVTDYTSLDDGGRHYDDVSDTATVTAGLPVIEVDKTVLDGPPAYLGEPTRWQIVVTNSGPAVAHDVDVVDVLPERWSYVPGAQVSLPDGSTTARDPDDIDGDPVELSWENLGDLETGESITIVLSATPDLDAPVGGATAHVNQATATAQDLEGTDGNVVTTDSDDAETRIDSADLTLTKQAVGDPVAGADFSWTLTVGNAGDDTAAGPFVVTDTLPDDVTGATASGTGWTCSTTPPPAAGDPETVTCQRTDPTDVLADSDTFPVITVTALVPDDVAPNTALVNTAVVDGHTHDPDPSNNTDDTTTDVTVESDMGIEKSLAGNLVPGTPATYTIAVENAGPSQARGPIVVTDTLPAGTTFDSWTGTDWDLEQDGQNLTFTFTGTPPVPVGSLPQITVTVLVDSSVTADVTNTASVTEPTDPTSGAEEPDSDSVTSSPVESADLGIEKSSLGTFKAGEQGVYEFVVTDFGPSDAAGPITVTDTLPSLVTYDSVDSVDGWTCSTIGQDLTCTLAGGIVDGDSSTLEVTVDIDETLTGDVLNTATVDGTTPDANPGNDSEDDDTGVTVESDLSVEKTLVTAPVVAGEDVSYEIAVRNNGPATSPGTISVTDSLPAGLTFVSATGTGWSCAEDTGLVTCDRAAVLAADTDAPVITVVAAVGSGVGTTTLTNVANVDGPATDPTPGNNTDDVDTPVTEDTEISVTKTATGADPVRAGENATFEVVVSNTGSSDARTVSVTELLPAGMTLVSASGTGWTCVADVCTVDRVAAGQSAPPLTVVARVASGTPDGASLTNSVEIATVTPGDTPAGNTDDATVDVVADADLQLVKTHVGSAVAGTSTQFAISVTNNGPSDSVGPTTVVDDLPAGLSYLSASAPWTCIPGVPDASVVSCTTPDGLVAGTTLPLLSLQVMVDASAETGTVTNSATVSSPTTDSVPANDTDTADVAVDRVADLSIVKSHEGVVRVGDTVAFTLLVTNQGPSTARQVVVTDALPDGLDFVSAVGTGWACTQAERVVTCSLSSALAPGAAAAPITLTAGVTPLAYPGVINTASVDSETTDINPVDNESSDPVTVPALVDLTVAKSHTGKLKVGREGSYVITVTNEGPTPAPGPVTVTDTLPDGLAFVSASGAGWTCSDDAGTVTCVRDGALDVGATASIDLVVDVLPSAYPQVTNVATVTSPSEETDEEDGSSTDVGDVVPTVGLRIDKSVVDVSRRAATYKITVTNDGPSDTVEPVEVRDPMPEGLEVVSAAGNGWSCTTTPRRADCVHADVIRAGESRSITLKTLVTADPGSDIVNVASITGIGKGGGDSHDDAELTVPGKGQGHGGPDGDGDGDGAGDGSGGSGPGGLLPDTGGPALVLLPIGLLLVAAGALMLSRRRRS